MSETNPARVIFLDVDGVLNDCSTKECAPSGCLGVDNIMLMNLKEIVRKTNAKVVLTSSWKSEWGPPYFVGEDGAYLVQRLAEFGIRIDGITEDSVSDRGAGVYRYLQKHPEVKSWVVLDDNIFKDYDSELIKNHLVLTNNFWGGLTYQLADKAVEIILSGKETS